MEALGEIGFNLPGLASQIINFFVLMVLLYLLLIKPVVRMLDRRAERIKESLEAAERARQESQRGGEEVQRALQEARVQGQQLIEDARKTGERLIADARAEARRQGEEEAQRARAAIEQERDEAVQRVRQEFSGLAILAAEKVIHRSLDRKAHEDLIEQVLQDAKRG